MATAKSNEPRLRTITCRYDAAWVSPEVSPSDDPKARAFGPLFTLDNGEQDYPVGDVSSPKQVLHIPVKKAKEQEHFPTLGLYISLVEQNNAQNVTVGGHHGAKVIIKVFNRWSDGLAGRNPPEPLVVETELDADGICYVEFSKEQVKQWLEPKGKLGGRVNENLFDFSFECPSLIPAGEREHGVKLSFRGQSRNRVFLYRRKVILFLPGVFGSQVRVTTPDGRKLGFPDFYKEPQTFVEHVLDAQVPQRIINALGQDLGGLECDEAGEPLLKPLKAMLLTMKLPTMDGIVYDVFDKCRKASKQYFRESLCSANATPGLRGPAIRLVELRILAYDWRCDLTEAAQNVAQKVMDICQRAKDSLRNRSDYDDEVALAGHSTGGVIIRRVLKEPEMDSMVSHAFYVNVPFRGAPKALGVILTGQDPPGGDRMIPFVRAKSLRALTLGMPIVYHLAPTASYPDRVAITPERPISAPRSIEAEKSELVNLAIKTGFLASTPFIKSSVRSDRKPFLAATADKWHSFWARASEMRRAREVYKDALPGRYHWFDEWFAREVKAQDLTEQDQSRTPGGWNPTLAEKARKFHEEAESVAREGKWADKSFIFYSVAEAPTTLRIHFEIADQQEFLNIPDLLKAEHLPVASFTDGMIVPPRSKTERKSAGGGGSVPVVVAHQWSVQSSPYRPTKYRRTVWHAYARRRKKAGDGTVPIESLTGFGGPANIVRPIPVDDEVHFYDTETGKVPNGPDHSHAPSELYVWERMVEILQGTLDPDKFLEHRVGKSAAGSD